MGNSFLDILKAAEDAVDQHTKAKDSEPQKTAMNLAPVSMQADTEKKTYVSLSPVVGPNADISKQQTRVGLKPIIVPSRPKPVIAGARSETKAVKPDESAISLENMHMETQLPIMDDNFSMDMDASIEIDIDALEMSNAFGDASDDLPSIDPASKEMIASRRLEYERKIATLEKALEDAQKRAANAEGRLLETTRRAAEAESRAMDAETRADEADAHAAELVAYAEEVTARVEAAEAQLDQLQANPAVVSEDAQALEKRAIAAETRCSQLQDKLIRASADFDNYRKRVTRDQDQFKAQAEKKLITDFLSVMDNFERAIQHAKVANDYENLLHGVELTAKMYVSALAKHGCVAFDSLGKEFDPSYHDVLSKIEDNSVPNNTVVQEHLKGYMMHGTLLRPALVVVSQNNGDQSAPEIQIEVDTIEPLNQPDQQDPS